MYDEVEFNKQNKKAATIQMIRSFNSRLRMIDILDYYELEYEADKSFDGRFTMLCPFHNDHTPSLHIYTQNESGRDSWCCFVCTDNGDCFRFIQWMEEHNYQNSIIVAQNILSKTGTGTIINEKTKEYQRKLRLAKKSFLLQYKIGIKYRDWLIDLEDKPVYDQACDKVMEIFKEIDRMLEAEEYEQLTKFVKQKAKKLEKVRKK